MPDQELVKPKRWEGKSFPFKLKFMLANYPEIAVSIFCFGVLLPAGLVFVNYFNEGSRFEGLKKFKGHYKVVRDDDPDVEKFLREKEIGREHFPKY